MHGIRHKSKTSLDDTLADKIERKASKSRLYDQDRREARVEMSRLRGVSLSQLGDQHI
jgi:hypothetical protein